MKRRILASILSFILVAQVLPVSAGSAGESPQTPEENFSQPAGETVSVLDENTGLGEEVPAEEPLRYLTIGHRATRYDSATIGMRSLLEKNGSGNYQISAEYRMDQPVEQDVQMTFTLILNPSEEPVYLTLAHQDRIPVNADGWTTLCGTFEINTENLAGAELKLVDDFELLAGDYQAAVQVRNVCVQKEEQELLYNGDFHAGLDGWRANECLLSLYEADGTLVEDTQNAGYTAPYEIITAQEPARYMRIDSRKTPNASIEQNIAEQMLLNGPGKYRVSVTYRAPSKEEEQPVSFVVGVRGSGDGDEARWYALGDLPAAPSSEKWVTVSADFDIEWTGEPVYGVFKPVDGTAAESVWISDVSMISLKTQSQVLKNNNFENGANSYDLGWTANECTPSMVDHENVSAEMLGGYNAFLVRREHEYASPVQHLTDAFKEKGSGLYTVTAWYRSDNEKSTVRARYTFALTVLADGKETVKYYTAHPVSANFDGFVRLQSTFYFDWSEGALKDAYFKILDNVDGETTNAIVTGISVKAPDGTELLKNADFSDGIHQWDITGCVCYILFTDGTVSQKYYTGYQEDDSADNIPSYSSGSGSGTAKDKSKRYILIEDRANQYVSPEQDITAALNAAGPGKYTVKGWYKSFTGAEKVNPTIGIKRKGSKGYQYYSAGKPMLTSKRGWAELDEEINLFWEGELESAFIKLVDGTGNKNSIYVDEFSLTADKKSTNLLINGDFEQGAYGWKDNGCSMTVIGEPLPAEYTDLRAGETCMMIKERQDRYASGLQDITEAVKKNGKGKYEASVTLRTEYGAQKPTFTLIVKGTGDRDNRYYNINVNRPAAVYNKWVVCQGLFDIDWSGELEYAQFKLIDGFEGTDSMYIKNASLKKAGGQELLKNPDFQQGTKEWIGENCALQALGNIKVDQNAQTRVGFSGQNYLMIRDKQDGFASITQDITKPLRKNGQGHYQISGWYKAADHPEFVTFTVGLLDDTDEWVYHTLENEAVYVDGEKWVRLYAEFDLQWQGMLQDAMFKVLDGYRSTSSMYVDDFQFICESTGEQILRNPDFEGGDAGWIEERVSCVLMDDQGIEKPDTRIENNGSYLKVYGRDSKYSAPEQVITSALEENGPGFYEISAWFKRIDGETPVSLTVSVLDETEEWKYFVVPVEQQVVLEDDSLWYQVRALVDVHWTGKLEEAFFKLIDGTNGGESMYVDDVSMIRQDTGAQLLKNTDFEQGRLYYRRNEGFLMEPVYQ